MYCCPAQQGNNRIVARLTKQMRIFFTSMGYEKWTEYKMLTNLRYWNDTEIKASRSSFFYCGNIRMENHATSYISWPTVHSNPLESTSVLFHCLINACFLCWESFIPAYNRVRKLQNWWRVSKKVNEASASRKTLAN